MSEFWVYKGIKYLTEAEAQTAYDTQQQDFIDNPATWCDVKILSHDENGNWIIPLDKLTSSQITNMDSNSFYAVSSIEGGGTDVGLTKDQALEKIEEYKQEYIAFWDTQQITHVYEPEAIAGESE